jgi:hypothetical protein
MRAKAKPLIQVIVSVPVSAFRQANQAQFYVSMSRAAELYRREVAIAELQDFIFINDTRTYSEHSNRARLGLAYIKEHWAEIMDELKAASENEHKRTRHEQ